MRRWVAVLLAMMIVSGTGSLRPVVVAADGGWLDAPRTQWNAVGMRVPAAPPMDPATDPRCGQQERPSELPEDADVVAAGWHLFGSYEGGWGITLVKGLSGYDGMCRPLGFNEFVFVGGTFAGTIAPTPMDSRTDGVVSQVGLRGPAELSASFARYKATDPLCCPSDSTFVTYTVNRTPTGPVLVAN